MVPDLQCRAPGWGFAGQRGLEVQDHAEVNQYHAATHGRLGCVELFFHSASHHSDGKLGAGFPDSPGCLKLCLKTSY